MSSFWNLAISNARLPGAVWLRMEAVEVELGSACGTAQLLHFLWV